jgi:hypothetical protein
MVAPTANRVSRHTSAQTNARIHEETDRNIAYYSQLGKQGIDRRLAELDREWDIERALEANAASVTLFGFMMGTLWNRKWFILPGLVGGFLLQHAIEGWCPPLPVLRRLGFRTAQEIEHERHALLRARDNQKA